MILSFVFLENPPGSLGLGTGVELRKFPSDKARELTLYISESLHCLRSNFCKGLVGFRVVVADR